MEWIKSKRSGPYSDNCVEVADTGDGVAVRNSKNPDGPQIRYTRAEFRAFVEGAKDGDFDHLLI